MPLKRKEIFRFDENVSLYEHCRNDGENRKNLVGVYSFSMFYPLFYFLSLFYVNFRAFVNPEVGGWFMVRAAKSTEISLQPLPTYTK